MLKVMWYVKNGKWVTLLCVNVSVLLSSDTLLCFLRCHVAVDLYWHINYHVNSRVAVRYT